MTHASPPRPTRRHASALFTFAIVGLCSAGDTHAGSTAPPATSAPDAVVTVDAQQYRWAGQVFDSLDALAATVLPRTPRSMGLLACGTQSMSSLLAAAHHFRHLELHLSANEAGSTACQEATAARPTPVSLRETAAPQRIDDDAVRAWWQQSMP